MYSSNCCFLTHILVSQETSKVVWYSISLRIFQFVVIHTVKDLSIVSEAEVKWSEVTQSCLTLCDPVDGSMSDSSVLHYLLEFAQTHVHGVRDAIQTSHPLSPPSPALSLPTPWTVAYEVPPSMGFSRQECWSGLPFPSPGDLPYPGIEPGSPTLQADALPSGPPGKPPSLS